jgi:hypothetical protein
MESKVTEKHDEVRILALVPGEIQGQVRHQLEPLGVMIDFIGNAAEWWSMWGEIAVLNPRPEILVYAPSASFELWSGVLELGGYDVIVAPFRAEELQSAVLQAAASFKECFLGENASE